LVAVTGSEISVSIKEPCPSFNRSRKSVSIFCFVCSPKLLPSFHECSCSCCWKVESNPMLPNVNGRTEGNKILFSIT
ncbi:hypothetical protein AWRI1499_2827, partial [Brettanomyces bruxellensis AWRI1499]